MLCPFCQSTQISVTNSRPTKKSSQIWRRRKCLKCGNVFTTYERMNLSHLLVVKKSGRKEKFRRAKLYTGIYHSIIESKNADRGKASEFADGIVGQIEQEILKKTKKEIRSTEMIEIVLKRLKRKSLSAFLRYLAYREEKNKKKIRSLLRKHLR